MLRGASQRWVALGDDSIGRERRRRRRLCFRFYSVRILDRWFILSPFLLSVCRWGTPPPPPRSLLSESGPLFDVLFRIRRRRRRRRESGPRTAPYSVFGFFCCRCCCWCCCCCCCCCCCFSHPRLAFCLAVLEVLPFSGRIRGYCIFFSFFCEAVHGVFVRPHWSNLRGATEHPIADTRGACGKKKEMPSNLWEKN